MSAFSECFNKLKEKRNLTSNRIAQICGFDTSIVYKWANGNHLPKSSSVIEVMTEKLQFSNTESMELQHTYERTKLGDEKYSCYQKIIEILECLESRGKEYRSQNQGFEIIGDVSLKPLPEFQEYNNKLEIMNGIHNLLSYFTYKKNRNLYLKIQPVHQDIMMLIRMFCSQWDVCNIEEIVCFSDKCYDSVLDNLEILKGIINLLVQKHPIQVYSMEQLRQDGELLENWIIADDFVMEFADDFSYGMITTNPVWIAHFRKHYEELRKNSRILGKKECKAPEDFLHSNYFENAIGMVAFEYMPCIGNCLTKEILDQYMFEEIPEREKLIDMILDYNNLNSKRFKNLKSFFFRDGLIEFMETGKVEIFPYEVYYPLKYEACCTIVQNEINLSQQGIMDYQMMKDGNFSSLKGIYIEQIQGKEPHLMIEFHFDEKKKERFVIYLAEIQKDFEGFFEFLSDSAYVYSVEETAKQMQEVLDEYRRRA